MSDQLDDDEVRNCIRETFVKYVVPDNVIWLFHKYDIGVLTENDIQQVKAETRSRGPMEGAQLLLNRLPPYNNWFPCLLKVLQDDHVMLEHVAKTMQDKVNDLKDTRSRSKSKWKNHEDIDLLLIGRSGNGKSATGNSILRQKIFPRYTSFHSAINEIKYAESDFYGRVIKVVDGLGVGGNRFYNEEYVDRVKKDMVFAIACNPRGYHAFLLVVRFGSRFTDEDCDTIAFLKTFFGNDFVRNFCILVVTHGDSFEEDSEETGQTFQDWCKDQKGVIRHMLRECNNRAILFNNFTRDTNKRNQQVSNLITMVDSLPSQGHRYDPTPILKKILNV